MSRWKAKAGVELLPALLPAEKGKVDIIIETTRRNKKVRKIFVQGNDITVEKLADIQQNFFKGRADMTPGKNGVVIMPPKTKIRKEGLECIAADIGEHLDYYVPPQLLSFSHPITASL